MIVLRGVLRAHRLFHERLDVGGWDRAEPADPLAVLGEEWRVAGEVAAIEIAAVVEEQRFDFRFVFEDFQPGGERVVGGYRLRCLRNEIDEGDQGEEGRKDKEERQESLHGGRSLAPRACQCQGLAGVSY